MSLYLCKKKETVATGREFLCDSTFYKSLRTKNVTETQNFVCLYRFLTCLYRIFHLCEITDFHGTKNRTSAYDLPN